MSSSISSGIRFAFNAKAWNPSKAEWLLACHYIQPEERKRISEFYFKNDAKLCIAARLLIRYSLAILLQCKWSDLVLKRSSRGKPLLCKERHQDCGVSFNASHQGDYAVSVSHPCSTVGIDIMDIREQHGDNGKFFKLMDRQFTDHEWENIRNHDSNFKRMKSFYRHWCLKESYVKAIGDGISFPLQSLNFKINSDVVLSNYATDTQLFVSDILKQEWIFDEIMLDENHCVAVATNTTNRNLKNDFKVLEFNDITKIADKLPPNDKIDNLFMKSYDKPFKNK